MSGAQGNHAEEPTATPLVTICRAMVFARVPWRRCTRKMEVPSPKRLMIAWHSSARSLHVALATVAVVSVAARNANCESTMMAVDVVGAECTKVSHHLRAPTMAQSCAMFAVVHGWERPWLSDEESDRTRKAEAPRPGFCAQ